MNIPHHHGQRQTVPDESSYLSLQQELIATKEYLQSIIIEKESEIEELKSSIDDVQRRHDGVRAVNEEFVTAREELQSANEELVSVNDHLSERNRELNILNNELVNLIGSVSSAAIILDKTIRIRRYTPASEKLLNLSPADIGRSVGNVRFKLTIPDLEELVRNVIKTRVNRETEVSSSDGKNYVMNIRPYKSPENVIEGVVVVFFEQDPG
jgi:two-component system CheB/CheR fusion protein